MAKKLLSTTIQYIQKWFSLKIGYGKLNRLESEYNHTIIKLGKKFTELSLGDESSTSLLDEIKTIDKSFLELSDQALILSKDKDKESQELTSKIKEHNTELDTLTKKLKEINYILNKEKKKQKEIDHDISTLEKEIKKLEQYNLELQQKIAEFEMNRMDEKEGDDGEDIENRKENVTQEIATLKDEITDHEKKIEKLAETLNTKIEVSKNLKDESTSYNDDFLITNRKVVDLKNEWKKNKGIHKNRITELQTKIEEIEAEKEVLEEKKIFPYRELGLVAMDSEIDNDELKSLYQKLDTGTKGINKEKKRIIQLEEFFHSLDTIKIKRNLYLFLFFSFSLVILILALLY